MKRTTQNMPQTFLKGKVYTNMCSIGHMKCIIHADDKQNKAKTVYDSLPACGSCTHYIDVIMRAMASQITGVTIVYVAFIHAQIKENIKARRYWPLFVRWIHRWAINYSHKEPLTRKMFPFDNVIMNSYLHSVDVHPTRRYLIISITHTHYMYVVLG